MPLLYAARKGPVAAMGNKKLKNVDDYKSLQADRFHRRVDTKDFYDRMICGLADGDVWTKPDHQLDIDDQIELLIDPKKRMLDPNRKMRPPSIKSHEYLSSREILCPYEYARTSLVEAVRFANDETAETLKRRTVKHDRLSQFKNNLSMIEHYSKLVSADLKTGILNSEHRHGTPEQIGKEGTIIESADIFDIAIDIENLSKMYKKLNQTAFAKMKHYRPGKPGSFWERRFVEYMGFVWRTLTGANPNYDETNDYFRNFIDGAYQTIYKAYNARGYNMGWRSIIEGACRDVNKHTGWAARDQDPGVLTDYTKHYIDGYANDGDYYWREKDRKMNDKAMRCAIALVEANTEEAFTAAVIDMVGNISILATTEDGQKIISEFLRLGYAIRPSKRSPPLTLRRRLDPRVKGLRYLPAPQPYVSSRLPANA